MAVGIHEIRDPIHVFIRLDDAEREVLDSAPLQRLRHIHQLALTYLVYPGATHKRFEHSLGVMELASRVFDVVTDPANLSDEIRDLLPPLKLTAPDKLRYWRRILRMAALCHDAGHLPFSHASEKDLLPPDWDHERLTRLIISSEEMKQIWESVTPPLRAQDIEKVAVGPRKAKNLQFSDWEAILAEIIVGDAFGVDRIDYLLRDSYHTGVAYGRFDHYRLIDTLRILPQSDAGNSSSEPSVGIEEGGIQSVEALMIARYFMYSQVYFHRTRRIYDIHLNDYLKEWLNGGLFPTDLKEFLSYTDVEVLASLRAAVRDRNCKGHLHAQRLIDRKHFKRLYSTNLSDRKVNLDLGGVLANALRAEFGDDNFRHDHLTHQSHGPDFPVRTQDDVLSSLAVSEALKHLPFIRLDYIFVDRAVEQEAKRWLEKHRQEIVESTKEEHIDE